MYDTVNIKLLVPCKKTFFPQDVSQFDLTRKRISSSSSEKSMFDQYWLKITKSFEQEKLLQ